MNIIVPKEIQSIKTNKNQTQACIQYPSKPPLHTNHMKHRYRYAYDDDPENNNNNNDDDDHTYSSSTEEYIIHSEYNTTQYNNNNNNGNLTITQLENINHLHKLSQLIMTNMPLLNAYFSSKRPRDDVSSESYVDAHFANCIDDGHSIFGYAFLLAGGPFSW